MYSVIVPTMWRGVEFQRLLPLIDSNKSVSEIVIIDNDEKKRPNWIDSCKKLKIHSFGKNVFVNPAWNYGIEKAENNSVCILSDDIIFDVSIFDWLVNNPLQGPTSPAYALRNFSPPNRFNEDVIPPLTDPNFKQSYDVPYRFGCLMFVDKRKWIPIPPQIKIYFGDYWIWKSYDLQDQKPHYIEGFTFTTRDTTTSCKFGHVNEYELNIWNKEIYPLFKNELHPNMFDGHKVELEKEMEAKTFYEREITLKVY